MVPGRVGRRTVDAIVDLDGQSRVIEKAGERDFSGKDIIVIQAKATRLNAYVFGQALISPRLIEECPWQPLHMKSVLLCTADQPQIRELVSEEFPDLDILIQEGRKGNFFLPRIPGAAEDYAEQEGSAPILTAVCLTSGLSIDGVIVPGLSHAEARLPICQNMVHGRNVTTVHSEQRESGETPEASWMGMYMAGEVILSQRLLLNMGAASVKSIILCRGIDGSMRKAMKGLADFEIRTRDPGSATWVSEQQVQ